MAEVQVEEVVVLGGGSFGTALGQVLARKGHHVTILTRDPRTEASINNEHRNPKYLTDLTLHEVLCIDVLRRILILIFLAESESHNEHNDSNLSHADCTCYPSSRYWHLDQPNP